MIQRAIVFDMTVFALLRLQFIFLLSIINREKEKLSLIYRFRGKQQRACEKLTSAYKKQYFSFDYLSLHLRLYQSSLFSSNIIQDMSLPAQSDLLLQQPENLSSKDIELDKPIRKKFETLKEKGQPKFVLTRKYPTNNPVLYEQVKKKLKTYAASVKQEQAQNVDQFVPILLGTLEGAPGTIDPMLVLTEQFGEDIENLKIEEIVRQKTKVSKYAGEKKKDTSVRQCDKKSLESLSQLYDTTIIKNHRKLCSNVKSYLKSYKRFTQILQKSTQVITQDSQAYASYIDFLKEQMEFNKYKTTLEQSSHISSMNEQSPEREKNQMGVTPIKDRTNKNGAEKKDDTASTHKNKEGEEAKNEEKQSEKQRAARKRRTKEEVEREKVKRQEELQAKKREKQEKEKYKQMQKEKQKAEKAEKQRQKQLERLAKQEQRKAKQQEKEAKERQRQREKQLRQQERQAKEAEKRKKQQEKEKKKNPGKSLVGWFIANKPKTNPLQNDSPSKCEAAQEKSESKENQMSTQSRTDGFLQLIKSQCTPISACKQDFFHKKMKNENSNFEPFYTNIVSHKSRLQFTNFLVNEQRILNYTQPHFQMETGKYDDSSVEYEDLCGEMCNEDADEMTPQQQEQNEENSAIVPDNYLSGDQMSSGDESQDEIVVNIDQGGEWQFSGEASPIAQKFQMFCLYQAEAIPLSLNQTQQTNDLSVSLRCQLYKQMHGFCGSKDVLIKKLALITEKVPKSYLDNLVRQTTTKKANQRLVKPEIIEFLNEQKQGFSKQLQEIKARRDEQMMLQAKGRVTEKEKEIQRLILQEAGTYYIIDLLQFLRERGYKMRKKDLTSFIDERVGPHWDDIRRRMKKMQLKSGEKLNQFLKKEKDKESEKKQENNMSQEKCDAQLQNHIEEQKQEKKAEQKKEEQNQKQEQAKESQMQPQ